jgi:hypothetical protein
VREWCWLDDNPVRQVKKRIEPRERVRFSTVTVRAPLLETCRGSFDTCLYLVVVLAPSHRRPQG